MKRSATLLVVSSSSSLYSHAPLSFVYIRSTSYVVFLF